MAHTCVRRRAIVVAGSIISTCGEQGPQAHFPRSNELSNVIPHVDIESQQPSKAVPVSRGCWRESISTEWRWGRSCVRRHACVMHHTSWIVTASTRFWSLWRCALTFAVVDERRAHGDPGALDESILTLCEYCLERSVLAFSRHNHLIHF